jgi:hypothetical protein
MIHVIESKYPDVILYGDSEHYLHLVAQAVTPDSLMKHIILLLRFDGLTKTRKSNENMKRNITM